MLFAEEYLRNGQNGTQAAIAAGYGPKGAHTRANRLLKDPEIRNLIASRAAEIAEGAQLNTRNWARDLAAIAFCDIGDLYDEQGNLRPVEDLPEQVRRAIASMKVVKRDIKNVGTEVITEIRFWDKNAALVTIARHLGLFERDNAPKAPNVRLVVNLV